MGVHTLLMTAAPLGACALWLLFAVAVGAPSPHWLAPNDGVIQDLHKQETGSPGGIVAQDNAKTGDKGVEALLSDLITPQQSGSLKSVKASEGKPGVDAAALEAGIVQKPEQATLKTTPKLANLQEQTDTTENANPVMQAMNSQTEQAVQPATDVAQKESPKTMTQASSAPPTPKAPAPQPTQEDAHKFEPVSTPTTAAAQANPISMYT